MLHDINDSRAIIQNCSKVGSSRHNCTAVAIAELPAAKVSFQRQAGSYPPVQNVNSADAHVLAAVQFSGKYAISAANAVTTATFATFLPFHAACGDAFHQIALGVDINADYRYGHQERGRHQPAPRINIAEDQQLQTNR